MTANSIISGIEKFNKMFDSANQQTAQTAQTQQSAVDKVKTAQKNMTSTAESYHNKLQEYKETLKKSKQAAEDANAEKAVAEEGGPVSIGEALKLVETEDASRKQHRSNQFKYAKMQLKAGKDMLSAGFTVARASLEDSANGLVDSFKDPRGLISMFGGAAAGLVFGNSGIADAVQNASSYIFGFDGLEADNAVEEGVDEKHVAGLGSSEEYNAYMQQNGGGEPNDPYDTGTGPDADTESDIPAPTGGAAADPNVEATTLGESQFDDLIDSVNGVKQKIRDAVSERLYGHTSSQDSVSLAGAVAEGITGVAAGIMNGLPEEMENNFTDAMQALLAMNRERDAADTGSEPEAEEGPSYGA